MLQLLRTPEILSLKSVKETLSVKTDFKQLSKLCKTSQTKNFKLFVLNFKSYDFVVLDDTMFSLKFPLIIDIVNLNLTYLQSPIKNNHLC